MASEMAFNGHIDPAAIEATATTPKQCASGTLEDGEITEKQDAATSHSNELQLSRLEYATLENRFSQLQRQHAELQELAAAYSEVIRGFAPTAGEDVSIDQLQAEAGHDGLRARALETDVLRPLIREAGGFRELEQLVSDLRTVRDMSEDLKGSRGIVGLASQVRYLLQSKQKFTELQNEVNDSNGLRAKAVRYEKLMQAFADVQNVTSSQQPAPSSASMNPARARMISARPLEDDPDRDLYEAPLVAKPRKQTGSNCTPLGNNKVQRTAQHTNQAAARLKRKTPQHNDPSVTSKRPRVDLGRASALVEGALPATIITGRRFATAAVKAHADASGGQGRFSEDHPATVGWPKPAPEAIDTPVSMPPHSYTGTGARPLVMDLEWQGRSKNILDKPVIEGTAPYVRPFSEVGAVPMKPSTFAVATSDKATLDVQGPAAVPENTTVQPHMQKIASPAAMPDWMRSEHFFVDLESTISSGAPMSRCPSSPPSQDAQLHADIRSGPARLPGKDIRIDLPHPRFEWPYPSVITAQSAPIALDALKSLLLYPAALWVGAIGSFTIWNAYQSHDLKEAAEIPDNLLRFLLSELAKVMSIANASKFTQMTPSGNTCIATYMIDGPRLDLSQERRACHNCSSAARPCALLQDVRGVRTIVFLPIWEHLRVGKKWTDRSYWVREVN